MKKHLNVISLEASEKFKKCVQFGCRKNIIKFCVLYVYKTKYLSGRPSRTGNPKKSEDSKGFFVIVL
jgi:hypothetical protein